MTGWRSGIVLLATVLVVLMPVAWVIGVDQALWIAAAVLLGATALRSRDIPTSWIVLGALFVVIVIAGVLGATGFRWATLARELAIVLAFAAVVMVVSPGTPERSSRPFVVATLCFVFLSSAASIVSFMLQDPFRFATPIASLIPEFVARTGLGMQSFTERSLAEPSFFLGQQFLRPQGFYLFSTSQAVAQAVSLPLFVVAAAWHPRWRWLFAVAGLVTTAALVLSTTRSALAAILISLAGVWLARRIADGQIKLTIPLRGRAAVWTVGIGVVVCIGGIATGLFDPLTNVITTRSLEGRTALYEMTVDSWADRPIIGWGTEVDWTPTPQPSPTPSPTPAPTPTPTPTPAPAPSTKPDLPPLGSHSWYLGVLFKQGLVGLAVLIVLVAVVVRAALRCAQSPQREVQAVAVAVGAALLIGATESLWLDPATAVLVAIPIGLALRWGQPAERDAVVRDRARGRS